VEEVASRSTRQVRWLTKTFEPKKNVPNLSVWDVFGSPPPELPNYECDRTVGDLDGKRHLRNPFSGYSNV